MRHGTLKLYFAVSLFSTRFESKASKPKQTKKETRSSAIFKLGLAAWPPNKPLFAWKSWHDTAKSKRV